MDQRNYFMRPIILLGLAIIFCGCSSPSIRVSRSPGVLPQQIKKIALLPSGGVLADAIGVELLRHGYEIIDTATITSMMARWNLTELELVEPQNIRKLADKNIDTILLVKAVAGYDNRPESASVKLVSTTSGQVIIGATWQNGKGGSRGSPADGIMRVNLSDAAQQIAEGIGRNL